MNEIKAGDTLADIRRSGNLYVPFGTEEIRLVEDIHTGEWQYIRTDGTVVLALLDSPGRASIGCDGPDSNKGQISFAEGKRRE